MLYSSVWTAFREGLMLFAVRTSRLSVVVFLAIRACSQRLLLRPDWVAAFSILLLFSGISSRAEASCGDWLADHSGGRTQILQPDDRPAVPAPCHGPSCRQSRDQLPVAPLAPNRQLDGPERWCRLIDDVITQPTLTSLLSPEPDLFPLCGFVPRIERPPRV